MSDRSIRLGHQSLVAMNPMLVMVVVVVLPMVVMTVMAPPITVVMVMLRIAVVMTVVRLPFDVVHVGCQLAGVALSDSDARADWSRRLRLLLGGHDDHKRAKSSKP